MRRSAAACLELARWRLVEPVAVFHGTSTAAQHAYRSIFRRVDSTQNDVLYTHSQPNPASHTPQQTNEWIHLLLPTVALLGGGGDDRPPAGHLTRHLPLHKTSGRRQRTIPPSIAKRGAASWRRQRQRHLVLRSTGSPLSLLPPSAMAGILW